MPDTCTCPSPFTEDDLICAACERGEQDLYERLEGGTVPTGEAWDAFARRQG
jgi:hypothetical protein